MMTGREQRQGEPICGRPTWFTPTAATFITATAQPAQIDHIMSRLETIGDTSGTLSALQYLGLGTIVEEDFLEAGVKLDYDPAGDDSFTGFDRFGRIADQLWEHYHLDGNGDEVVDGTVDEYTYQYDRAGNVTSKSNATDGSLDELYGYNDLNELTSVKDSSDNVKQSWTLDASATGHVQRRPDRPTTKTFNAANEENTTSSVSSRRNTMRRATPSSSPSRATRRPHELRLRCLEPPGFGHLRHDHGRVSIRRRPAGGPSGSSAA